MFLIEDIAYNESNQMPTALFIAIKCISLCTKIEAGIGSELAFNNLH
jgi:hypothetical protein